MNSRMSTYVPSNLECIYSIVFELFSGSQLVAF